MDLEERTEIRKQALSQLESMGKEAQQFYMNPGMRSSPGPWWDDLRQKMQPRRRRPRRRPSRQTQQEPIQPTREETRQLRQYDLQQALEDDIKPIEYVQRNRALNSIAGTYPSGQPLFGQNSRDKARQRIQDFDRQQVLEDNIDPMEYTQRNQAMGDMFNDPLNPSNYQFGEDLSG